MARAFCHGPGRATKSCDAPGRMTEPFTRMLTGGHRNSLGRTQEVVEITLADGGRLDGLFAALAYPDELVRMRAGDRSRRSAASPRVLRALAELLPTALLGIGSKRAFDR